MTRFLIVAACVVFPSLVLGAPADSTSAAAAPRNSLHGGMWALQFDVNGSLLSVDPFSGGVSVKRQFTRKSALRFGVGFNGQGSTSDPNIPGSPNYHSEESRDNTSVEVLYQRYFNPSARVNAYWGIGPSVDLLHLTNETSADSTHAKSTLTSWGLLGAEWFFVPELSLHAEYTATGGYTRETRENSLTYYGQPPDKRKTVSDGWYADVGNRVRVGLSIYF